MMSVTPVLRLALNQSRRDLSDAQAKLNEYRYIKDADNSTAQEGTHAYVTSI